MKNLTTMKTRITTLITHLISLSLRGTYLMQCCTNWKLFSSANHFYVILTPKLQKKYSFSLYIFQPFYKWDVCSDVVSTMSLTISWKDKIFHSLYRYAGLEFLINCLLRRKTWQWMINTPLFNWIILDIWCNIFLFFFVRDSIVINWSHQSLCNLLSICSSAQKTQGQNKKY